MQQVEGVAFTYSPPPRHLVPRAASVSRCAHCWSVATMQS